MHASGLCAPSTSFKPGFGASASIALALATTLQLQLLTLEEEQLAFASAHVLTCGSGGATSFAFLRALSLAFSALLSTAPIVSARATSRPRGRRQQRPEEP